MYDKISRLQESLRSIGLEQEAKAFGRIAHVYKTARDDLSTEAKVLHSVADILDEIKDLSLNSIYQGRAALPGYAIETKNKKLVKTSESLEGFTKREIMLGIYNYLLSFVKQYMNTKFDRISYENEDRYAHAINKLSDALTEWRQVNNVLRKGITKQSLGRLWLKTLETATKINFYLDTTRKLSTEATHQKWVQPPVYLPSAVNIGPKEQKSWQQTFASLKFDLEAEMSNIEKDFMSEYEVDPDDFYDMIRSLRSQTSVDKYRAKPKTSSVIYSSDDLDDPDDLDLSDLEQKIGPKLPSSNVKWKDMAKKKQSPDDMSDEDSIPNMKDTSEKAKKNVEEETSSPFRQEELIHNLMGIDSKVDSQTLYKQLVDYIMTHRTFINKEGTIFPPGLVLRGYTNFLLPLFRSQYKAVLMSAYQIYMSVFQVAAAQNSLAKVLRSVASGLES